MTHPVTTWQTPAIATLALVAALALAGCTGSDQPAASASGSSLSASSSSSATNAPEGTTVITKPADGSTVVGPRVTVKGEGTAFEGTLKWQIVRAGTTKVVKKSFTTAGANGKVGPFSFYVELTPGEYTLEVWEPAEGEGPDEAADTDRIGLVTSTFTVT